MKRHLTLLAACLTAGLVNQTALAAENWQDLFDGKTLQGWVQRGGKAKYAVEEGCIVGSSVLNTPNSFLCTEKLYANFILEFEFKVDPKLNSGVQVRSEFEEKETTPKGKDGKPQTDADGKPVKVKTTRVFGYQVEIDPAARAWSAGLYDEGRRGWLYPGKLGGDAKEFTKQGGEAFKKEEWNRVRVEARGDTLKTWLNGAPRAEIKDSLTPKGLIGLQVHGTKEAGLQVRWRNLRIQVLD